jgi:hypothetical protein
MTVKAKAARTAKARKGPAGSYNETLATKICDALADGKTLRSICSEPGLPNERTVRRWAQDPNHPFSPQYVRAREVGYLMMADEMIDIADDGTNDWMERLSDDKKPLGWVLNGEHVQRSRVRIETRKWLLSKALPKMFGDRVVNEITGKDGGPIETVDASPRDEISRRISSIASRTAANSNTPGSDRATG